jgi:hypothetical protein
MNHTAAYELGYDSYPGKEKNPYPEQTQDYSDYLEGRNAAQADCAY